MKVFQSKHPSSPPPTPPGAILPNSELEIKPIGNITVSSPLRSQTWNYKAEHAGSLRVGSSLLNLIGCRQRPLHEDLHILTQNGNHVLRG
jgi:hypothetical protein